MNLLFKKFYELRFKTDTYIFFILKQKILIQIQFLFTNTPFCVIDLDLFILRFFFECQTETPSQGWIFFFFFFQRCSIPPLSDILTDIRAQCVQHASLILQGVISPSASPSRDSPLLTPLLTQTIPRGFLLELVAKTHVTPVIFSRVSNYLYLFEFRG